MRASRLSLIAVVIGALALTGCMQTSASVTTGYAPVDEPYRLDAGDKLRIVVYGQEGLTNTYAVGASGAITMPLIGSVSARGLTPAELSFDYQEHFGDESPDAYERLLLAALLGDPTLFLRSDEIESSWRYADGLLGAWSEVDAPVLEYPAASWGPMEADDLFYGCEGGWSRD